MTHPNVEYFQARVQATIANNEALKNRIKAEMQKTNNLDLLVKAHGRLEATETLVQTLMSRIEDYEERIALLS